MIKTIDDFKTCPFCHFKLSQSSSMIFSCLNHDAHNKTGLIKIHLFNDLRVANNDTLYLEYYIDDYLIRISYASGWLVLHPNRDVGNRILIFENFNWQFDPYNIPQIRNKIKTWVTFS